MGLHNVPCQGTLLARAECHLHEKPAGDVGTVEKASTGLRVSELGGQPCSTEPALLRASTNKTKSRSSPALRLPSLLLTPLGGTRQLFLQHARNSPCFQIPQAIQRWNRLSFHFRSNAWDLPAYKQPERTRGKQRQQCWEKRNKRLAPGPFQKGAFHCISFWKPQGSSTLILSC